jgi:Protein of unknown function (DUF3152)
MRAAERIASLPRWAKITVPALLAVSAVALGAVLLDAPAATSVHTQARRDGPTSTTATSTSTTTTTTSTTTSTTTTTVPPPPETTVAPGPEETLAPALQPEPPPPDPAPSVRVVTYSITTNGAVVSNLDELASVAAQTYLDPRGWAGAGVEFQRVESGGDFTLVLANASAVPAYAPGVCDAIYSCQAGRYVVLNDDRWSQGSPNWPGPLGAYRQMVLNHETGHWLGLGHAVCPGAGELAPVMQQQSIDMQGCAPNSWPLPGELDRVRR